MATILTPDQRLRVFVSSTLQELAEERKAAKAAIIGLHMSPVMFELGARPHPPRQLYRAYLEQSHIFVGIYWQRYGWVAPGEDVSGLEDEYRLSCDKLKLIYVKMPAPEREERLKTLLRQIQSDDQASYKQFSTAKELKKLIENDLAVLLTERFASSLRSTTASEAAAASPPATLPLLPTPFVGREREVAEVSSLLLHEGVRLVTLVGPGGVGKSRLALEAATSLRDRFRDAVYFVPLAHVQSPDLVVPAIAGTLNVGESGSTSLLDSLKGHLQGGKLLLLLDNFEQLEEAAPVLSELLTAAPALRLLVTSRSPLRLSAEHLYEVPPLSLPSAGRSPFEAIRTTEAVQLFVARARAVKPTFSLTVENALAVAELCYRLDGLPLAIELAAARVSLLPPQALLKRLDRRFELLKGGARDLPGRQQTLRNTIDWSYDLLSTVKKETFARLAVFVGGFSLEAAEAVCAEGDFDVIEGLTSLVGKSLVRPDDTGDEGRFSLLESIREYALEKLEASGQAADVRWRHASFYSKLAEAAGPQLMGPQQSDWLKRLDQEHDNLRAAQQTLRQEPEMRLSLVSALFRFWLIRGYLSEGREALAQTLSATTDRSKGRAKALHVASVLARAQGDYRDARLLLEEALTISRTLEDKRGVADALSNLGVVNQEQRDYPLARSQLEESLAIRRELGDEHGVVVSLGNIGNTVYQQGEYALARSLLEDGLAKARALGDKYVIATFIDSLGGVAKAEGDAIGQRTLYEESLALSRELGDKPGVALTLCNLGEAAVEQGQYGAARTYLEEAAALQQELKDQRGIAFLLDGFARLAAAEGDAKRAAQLYGAAEAVREVINASLSDAERSQHQREVATLRTRLDEATFVRLWNKGNSMRFEEAVVWALSPSFSQASPNS